MDILENLVNRKFIVNNKSKIAIISSILIHFLLLFSSKSDKYLGTTNKPIEFTPFYRYIGFQSIKDCKACESIPVRGT